ncbi:MAG: AAA family ATPase [Candidatus Bathyarchaeota archaeon]|nr:AAA family ATPase [Candidatus Bathyarchaeota archaeon]
MKRIIPTGCGLLDERLGGGLLEGNMVLVFGEAETGKTTLAIQCAVNCARMSYKTIFIDCDSTFFPRRMAQIAIDDFEALAHQIILMKPEDFEQQTIVIDRLNDYISKKVGLIVVDTITNLYSERLGDDMKKTFALNRELNRQMACLAQITKTHKVASLIVSQVRSVILEEHGKVQPVATRVLKFWTDKTISLKPTAQTNVIKANVETHIDKKPVKPIFLKIEEKGLHDYRG